MFRSSGHEFDFSINIFLMLVVLLHLNSMRFKNRYNVLTVQGKFIFSRMTANISGPVGIIFCTV